jgi:fatty acid desaturase
MVVAPTNLIWFVGEPKRGDETTFREENAIMLWTILVILLVLWLLGLVAHIGGGLIHLLLVVALIVFVVNLLTGRRTV